MTNLTATGTSGEWKAEPHRTRRNCTCVMGGHDGETFVAYYITDADARKIVLSVNALPLVDALIEATKTHMKFAYVSRTMQPDRQTPYCRQCGRAWPCPTAAARDALEAALRGEGE